MTWYLAHNPSSEVLLPLGNCDHVDTLLLEVDAQLSELSLNPHGVLTSYIQQSKTSIISLEGARAELRSKLDTQQVNLAIDIAKGAVLVGLGIAAIYASTPIAIGGVITYEVLSATGFMGLQLYYNKSDSAQRIVVGYFSDRVLLTTSIVGGQSKSFSGKALGRLASAVNALMIATDVASGVSNIVSTKDALERIDSDIADFLFQINKAGDNPAAWGTFRRNHLEAMRVSLVSLKEANASFACRIESDAGFPLQLH